MVSASDTFSCLHSSRGGSFLNRYTFAFVVLQSIYGESSICLWHGPRVGSPEHPSNGSSSTNDGKDTIRYVVSLKYVSCSFPFLLLFSYTIILSDLPIFSPSPETLVFHPTRTYRFASSFLYLLHTLQRIRPNCSYSHGTSVRLGSTRRYLDRYSGLLYLHLVLNGPLIPFASSMDFRTFSNDRKHGTKISSAEKRRGNLYERMLLTTILHHHHRWPHPNRMVRD